MTDRVVFAIPGDLATPTGGFAYDRRIIAELRKLGRKVDVVDIGAGFPRPSKAGRATAHLQLAAQPAGCRLVIDGLAYGVMTQAAQALQHSHRVVALVHHPLALESGLSDAEAAKFRASERLALSFARRVITTSATTATVLERSYAVAADKISVVQPGNDRGVLSERPASKIVNLLAVGSIVPRKGYDVLVAALDRIRDLPWRLTVVADPERNRATAAALRRQIASLRLEDRIDLVGVVTDDRLAVLYQAADLFVLASRYEGYGMAFTEAIAHGVPVVGTTAGAIPEAVPSGAGILVEPGNDADLAVVLMRLIGHSVELARLAAGARKAAALLPSWEDAAQKFAHALDAIA